MILFERPNQTVIDGISSVSWGEVEGSIADQPDLQSALDDKADAANLDGISFEFAPPFLMATQGATVKKIRFID